MTKTNRLKLLGEINRFLAQAEVNNKVRYGAEYDRGFGESIIKINQLIIDLREEKK